MCVCVCVKHGQAQVIVEVKGIILNFTPGLCKYGSLTASAQRVHQNVMVIVMGYKTRTSASQTGIVQELCESRGGRPELSVLTSLLVSQPSGFRGRKELLNHASALVTTCPSYVN